MKIEKAIYLVLLFGLLLITPSGEASITYTGGRIIISGQSATITEVNSAINNTALLEQTSAKVWLLKVPLLVESGATLNINNSDAERVNIYSPASNYIENDGNLYVNNSEICSWTGSGYDLTPGVTRSRITVNSNTAIADIRNSTFTHLGGGSNGGLDVINYASLYFDNLTGIDMFGRLSTPTSANPSVYWHNVSGWNRVVGASSGMNNTYIDGLTFNTTGYSGVNFERGTNFTLMNFTAPEGFTTSWTGLLANNFDNALFKNGYVYGAGITHAGFEAGLAKTVSPQRETNISFSNITLDHYKGDGSNGLYITRFDAGTDPGYYAENIVVEDWTCSNADKVNTGIYADHVKNLTIRNFKAVNWSGHGMAFTLVDAGCIVENVYIIDSKDNSVGGIEYWNVTNGHFINTANRIQLFEGGDYTEWYYLDVKVVDINGDPIPGAEVSVENSSGTVFPSNMHVTPQRGTRGLLAPQVKTSTLTGEDGHSPLPSDADNTIIIARKKRIGPVSSTFAHSITASKTAYSSVTVTGIMPDSAWLRTDPNIYPGAGKGTIVITLPLAEPDYAPPVVAIASPADNAGSSTPNITVSGTASDNISVRTVEVKVGTGAWQAAIGKTSWTKNITLAPGSNLITARAADSSGNMSNEVSVTVNYDNPAVTPGQKIKVYPNPFKPAADRTLNFINIPGTAKIRIINVSGEVIATLEENDGDGQCGWDGTTDNGGKAGSGAYVYIVTDGNGKSASGSIVLIR